MVDTDCGAELPLLLLSIAQCAISCEAFVLKQISLNRS